MRESARQANFMTGTWLLSLAALIAKILSALYRIPLQNIVGDRGFFVYQQIYPFYGLASSLALVGLPLFVSQVMAQDHTAQQANFQRLWRFAVLWGLSSALILWCGASVLAQLMGDKNLAPLIKAMALFYALAPLEGVLRGTFQGQLQMEPTAFSQITEQVVRVAVIILAALAWRQKNLQLYSMGAWAHAGAGLGAVVSLAVLAFYCRKLVFRTTFAAGPGKILYRRFFKEGLALSIFGSLIILWQIVDTFNLLRLLQQGHYDQPQIIKGIYDRGQPLAQLVMVIGLSFATSLMPQLGQSNLAMQQRIITVSCRLGLWLATSATVGLVVLMPQINTLLFKDAAYSGPLALYCCAVIFWSYATLMNIIMQARHQSQGNVLLVCLAVVLKLLLNDLLIKPWGLWGASWATVIASAFLALKLYQRATADLKSILWRDKYFPKLVLVAGGMAVVVGILLQVETFFWPTTRGYAFVEVVVNIIVGVLCVGIFSWHSQLLTMEEWHLVPLMKYLIKEKDDALR